MIIKIKPFLKAILLILIVCLIGLSCTTNSNNITDDGDDGKLGNNYTGKEDIDKTKTGEDKGKYEHMVKSTPIKNQKRTGTCWTYSTLSFLESEVIRKGTALPNIDLSEMYVVYYTYLEKAKEYLNRMGENPFTEGGLDYDTLMIIDKYGIVRQSDYPARNVSYHRPMVRSVLDILESTVEEHKDKDQLPKDVYDKTIKKVSEELKDYFGPVPQKIKVDWEEITPLQYAKGILKINRSDYVTITSYTHLPKNRYVELDIPDNWQHYDRYINVKLDEMVEIAKNSLRMCYSVSVDADVTEPGINFNKGYFLLKEEERIDDYEMVVKLRQEYFEDGTTTDDHAMHILGLDENEDEYGLGIIPEEEEIDWFYLKNSWGDRSGDSGFMHMSGYYFNLKVLAITVHKDTLSEKFEHIFPSKF
jgi:bleomycin hydrolase